MSNHPTTNNYAPYDGYTARMGLSSRLGRAVVGAYPVRYSADGWRNIDNTLLLTKMDRDSVWRNADSPLTVTFPEVLTPENQSQVSLSYKDYALSWHMEGIVTPVRAEVANNSMPADGREGSDENLIPVSQIKYAKIIPGLDVSYHLVGLTCKEELVVHEKDVVNGLIMRLTAEGMDFKPDEYGGISVRSGDENVFHIMPPCARDDGGEGRDLPVHYAMTEEREGITLRLVIDEASVEDAVYPIVIDPTTEVSSTDNCESLYMVQGDNIPKTDDLRAGVDSSNHERVSLIRFSQLPALAPGEVITKAVLRLYPGVATQCSPMYVGAYEPNHEWSLAGHMENSYE